jgi:hypothetical protein
MSGHYDRSAMRAGAQARDAAVAALVVEGRTLGEVGAMLGVSRERVRQRCERVGVNARFGRHSLDPIAIVRELRKPATLSTGDIARAVETNTGAVTKALRALDLYDAARRLFRWRRDRILLAKFAAFAAAIGHTPSKGELDRTPGVPCQSEFQQRFGGLQNAARRAGLKPNVMGDYWRGRRRS